MKRVFSNNKRKWFEMSKHSIWRLEKKNLLTWWTFLTGSRGRGLGTWSPVCWCWCWCSCFVRVILDDSVEGEIEKRAKVAKLFLVRMVDHVGWLKSGSRVSRLARRRKTVVWIEIVFHGVPFLKRNLSQLSGKNLFIFHDTKIWKESGIFL